eukprot:COSAG06_NODE_64680_length_259_cov_0.512500_1_plen_30_part_10
MLKCVRTDVELGVRAMTMKCKKLAASASYR